MQAGRQAGRQAGGQADRQAGRQFRTKCINGYIKDLNLQDSWEKFPGGDLRLQELFQTKCINGNDDLALQKN